MEILALGVTPEIARHPWGGEWHLTAVDSSEEMIRRVWPGDGPTRKAVLANWLSTGLPEASFDLILTDTGLALVVGAEQLAMLAKELKRLLRADGRIVMRNFTRVLRETPESVAEGVASGRMANFHELKLRLLMALEAANPGAGVRLAEAHECFQRLFPDRAWLARRLGCDVRTVAAIDAYRGREALYAFHSLEDIARAFEDFILQIGTAGTYPGADLCPVFSLTPKA